MEKMGLMAALLKSFGKKAGQSNTDFMAEMRNLTPEDKDYFKEHLKTVGIEVV